MIVKFFDMADKSNPFNGLAINDPERLAAALDSLRSREPFLAKLIGENGWSVDVGIGGHIGCVQYLHENGLPPYLMALAATPDARAGEIEFSMGCDISEVPPKYLLPFDKVKEIAIHFQQTGAPSPSVSWEEV